jgi:hypothetical protein
LFALAMALALLLGLAGDGLRAQFVSDDILNLHIYWFKPLAQHLVDHTAIVNGAFRPAGALLYCPLFALFGFNPAPYHAAGLLLLTANLCLTFAVVREVSGSPGVAGVTALLFAFNAHFADLYYCASTIYDLQGFFFFFLFLLCYARIRGRGGVPGPWSCAGLTILCWLAVCSKEHTATLPAVLLTYEILYRGARAELRRSPWRWLSGPGRMVAISGAVSATYLIPRLFSASAMVSNPAYRPHLSFALYAENVRHQLGSLFYVPERAGAALWIGLLAAALGTALALRRRNLLFAWLLFFVTSLPILFLPTRGPFVLYLPFAGVAMFVAEAGAMAVRRVARHRAVSADTYYVAVTVAATLLFVQHSREKPAAMAWIAAEESKITRLLEAAKGTAPPPRGGLVLILNSPFEESDWTGVLLLRLYYGDPQLFGAWTSGSEPPPRAEPFDRVIDMR